MRPATQMALVCLAFSVGACTPLVSRTVLNPRQAENAHVLRRIDEQLHRRDNCLSVYIAQNDKFEDRIENTAHAANEACVAEDDKLIDLLLKMDQDRGPQVTAAVRKESAFQAYRYVLQVRAEKPKPVEVQPAPAMERR